MTLKVEGEPRQVINVKTGEKRPARVFEDGLVRDEVGTFDDKEWDICALDSV